MRDETVASLTPSMIEYLLSFHGTQCAVRAEVQTLFLPICKDRHWSLAVAAKNTGMLELYDSLDDDEFREERNAILGSEIIQCFENLERNNNDWFQGISWTLTLKNLKGRMIVTTVLCFSSAPWLTE